MPNVREDRPEQRSLRYAIVDGMNVRDGRLHNYPPRWNEEATCAA
jgi:hypothetical protein